MKTLYINEIHKGYQVRDKETFAKDHARHLKRTKKQEFIKDEEGELHLENIKITNIKDKVLVEITEENIADYKLMVKNPLFIELGDFAFSCECVVKIV